MSPGNNNNKWFPLESNPQLINKYIATLGFDTSLYEFCGKQTPQQQKRRIVYIS